MVSKYFVGFYCEQNLIWFLQLVLVNRRESYIRCLAWHPHYDKIAIAIKDDEILVKNYSCTKDIQTLKHPNQKGIASIAWR